MPEDNSSEIKRLVNSSARLFNEFLERQLLPFINERAVAEVADPMNYSLLAGGKRVRPFLCLVSAGIDPEKLSDQSNPQIAAALQMAAAIESIHTYSLIHDDLPAMDDDDLRRGQPSCHVKFSEWQALLAGDALNTLAFELVALIGAEAKLKVELIRLLAEAAGISGMICGQTLDLNSEKMQLLERAEDKTELAPLLVEIHHKKTAAMIRISCEAGALISGCEERDNYRLYGERLGLLFQIVDDLLDVTGSSEELGKTIGKDEASGKLTFPALYGVDESRRRAENLIAELQDIQATLPLGELALSDLRPILKDLPAYIARRKN